MYETGESNGTISLSELICSDDYIIDGKKNNADLKTLFFAACSGGWPRCLEINDDNAKLEVAKDYYRQIYSKDISSIDDVNRNSEWARTILWSYARNMATLASRRNILADVKSVHNVSDTTIDSYVDVLKQLFVLHDIDAWTPQIRSKTAIRSARKHIFIDPSIGIAALGLSPDYFRNDLDTSGSDLSGTIAADNNLWKCPYWLYNREWGKSNTGCTFGEKRTVSVAN